MLFLGRRLFWLFVGLAGFVAGFMIVERMVHGQPEWVTLAIALAAGLLGIGIAIFLQRAAIAMTGAVSGGYLSILLAHHITRIPAGSEWMVALIGGVLGAILLSVFFDWALILLSSATGAALVVQSASMFSDIPLIAAAGLFVLGILVQGSWRRRHPETKES